MIDNVTKYAIYHLYDNSKTIDEIAKELKITKKKISEIISSRPAPDAKNIKPKDLIINETSGKKTRNVAIMTQAASMMSDQLKSTLTNTARDARMDSSTIFRPLDK